MVIFLLTWQETNDILARLLLLLLVHLSLHLLFHDQLLDSLPRDQVSFKLSSFVGASVDLGLCRLFKAAVQLLPGGLLAVLVLGLW